MEIKKLLERDALEAQKAGKQKKLAAFEQQQAKPEQITRGTEDRVSLSPLSRQLSQVSRILEDEETRQGARVAELKERVESGSYSVSASDVARSVVSFAADTEELG